MATGVLNARMRSVACPPLWHGATAGELAAPSDHSMATIRHVRSLSTIVSFANLLER